MEVLLPSSELEVEFSSPNRVVHSYRSLRLYMFLHYPTEVLLLSLEQEVEFEVPFLFVMEVPLGEEMQTRSFTL